MENNKINNVIKTENQALLLKHIVNEKEICRNKLSKLSNLSSTSVSSIVSILLKHSLIYESHMGDASGSGGRRPMYLKFNSNAGSIISIDVKSNSIDSALSTLNGEVLNHIQFKKYKIDENLLIEELYSIIDKHLVSQPNTPYGIVGIGIAIHGVVLDNIIRFTPNYALAYMDIHNKISNKYNIPTFIENEANLGALGEFVFSAHQTSLININLQNGVGAGIIEDNNLLIGQNGYIGEIGHSILFPNGKACSCGRKGCLEQYTSDEAIIRKISKHKNVGRLTIENIIEYARNQDEFVMDILEQSAEYLSVGINNLICSHDPEIIIINSKVFNYFPHLIDIISKSLVSQFTEKSLVKVTKLEGKSTLYGCTALVLQNFLKFKEIKFI